MYKFSKRSLDRLSTCDERLQRLCKEVIKYIDVGVLCGHRGKADQNAAYNSGKSKLKYPESKHNKVPSRAVDLGVFVNGKLTWEKEYYYYMLGIVHVCAATLGIKIRVGGDWDGDQDFSDQSFHDLPHIEILGD